MLTPADAELVERDQAIPGMALLLEPTRLLAHFADLGMDLRAVRTTYLRYKPGTSLIAGLALDAADGPVFGFATAYAEGCGPKAAKDLVYGDGTAGGAVGIDESAGVVFGTADCDRQLPGIARLLHGSHRDPPVLHDAYLHPLRYKPARRWVARVGEPAAPIAVVKVHEPGTVRGSAQAHRWLHAAGAPVPEVLHVNDEHGIMVVRWVPGRALERADPDPAAARAAGHALALLHAVPGDDRLPPARDLDARLSTALNAISTLAPALADETAELVTRITSMVSVDRPLTPVHGDFSTDQVVLGPDAAMLVDLDRAHLGDPADDLAGYAAAYIAGSAGSSPAATPCPTDDVCSALMTGYREGGGHSPGAALVPLTAAAVLALADEPFRLRQGNWPDRMAELVGAAGQVLDRT